MAGAMPRRKDLKFERQLQAKGKPDDEKGRFPLVHVTAVWPAQDGHEFLEKTPGTAPMLKHIHVQNPSGFLSFGLPIGDVPSMKRDIPVIVSRISADLFTADLEALRTRMTSDVKPDFTDELYRAAVR